MRKEWRTSRPEAMPTTDDIRAALANNDADTAETLIREVGAKRMGRGLSGHDQQDFEAQIRKIRAAAPKGRARKQ